MSLLRAALVLACWLLLAPVAGAHPPAIVGEAGERAVGEEVLAFRKSMADAITRKDAAKVREMYAPSFTHTHPDAKTAKREEHITAALSGTPLIETATATDVVVRVPNDWVAVVTGTSRLKSAADGRTYAVKWLAVYTRAATSWMLVAQQATRSLEIKP